MRVPGIPIEFDLEIETIRLREALFVDGSSVTTITAGKGGGARVLLDLQSELVAIVSKRGTVDLVPFSAVSSIQVARNGESKVKNEPPAADEGKPPFDPPMPPEAKKSKKR